MFCLHFISAGSELFIPALSSHAYVNGSIRTHCRTQHDETVSV